MKMIFDERYGELSFAQRAAYRKYNVSKSDHDHLVRHYGEHNHAQITEAVKNPDHHMHGMFSVWCFENGPV